MPSLRSAAARLGKDRKLDSTRVARYNRFGESALYLTRKSCYLYVTYLYNFGKATPTSQRQHFF
ncbi:MAG: hypothetical protein LUD02_16215 [Tannerellaceae bacterium]|nr:hypothetical protein [Tannerellaceae bacterium]